MSEPRTRSRSYKTGPPRLGGVSNLWNGSVWTGGDTFQDVLAQVPLMGTQITTSEGHPHQLIRRGQFVEDIGGDFSTTRQYVEPVGEFPQYTWYTGFNGRTYRHIGHVVAIADGTLTTMSSMFPPTLSSSEEKLKELGTTAISRCKPTNSVADASVFLGELVKDGLPSIIGSSLWRDKSRAGLGKSSDEFLNVQFGWKPIIADLKKFLEAARKADTVLKQYERDAGRLVRRRYDFPVRQESTTTIMATGALPASWPRIQGDMAGLPRGDIVRLREFKQRQWFTGAFTYAMPSGLNSRKNLDELARKADKLIGLSLTPDTVWNLSPWSWAIDWVTNAGDVTSNLSDWSLHGLVLRYGYIMEHTVVRDTYTFWKTQGPSSASTTGSDKIAPTSISFVTETKLRRRATPFGFGVTWEGLSPLQLAILAALGISRKW